MIKKKEFLFNFIAISADNILEIKTNLIDKFPSDSNILFPEHLIDLTYTN